MEIRKENSQNLTECTNTVRQEDDNIVLSEDNRTEITGLTGPTTEEKEDIPSAVVQQMTTLQNVMDDDRWDRIPELLKQGVNPNEVLKDGTYALTVIAKSVLEYTKFFISMYSLATAGVKAMPVGDKLMPPQELPLTILKVALDAIQELIKYGADTTLVDDNGLSAFDYCIQAFCEEQRRFAMEMSCVVDDEETGDKPLALVPFLSLEEELLKTIELLIQAGARVEGKDTKGQTALHKLTEESRSYLENRKAHKFEGFILALLPLIEPEKREYIQDQLNDLDNTRYRLVNALMKNKSMINIMDESGNSPIRNLCRKGPDEYEKYTKLLSENGIDINVEVDEMKNTLLHMASMSKNGSQIRTLLGYGASMDVENLKSQTPLHILCDEHHMVVHTFSLLHFLKSCLKPMLATNLQDANGWTPLHLVILSNKTDESNIIHQLIKMGAKVNIQDKFGMTPLHLACGGKTEIKDGACLRNDQIDVVRCLLEAGADINKEDIHGWTATDHATYHNTGTTIALLKIHLSRKSSAHFEDKDAKYDAGRKAKPLLKVFVEEHDEMISSTVRERFPCLRGDVDSSYGSGKSLMKKLLLIPGIGLLEHHEYYDEIYRHVHLLMKRVKEKMKQMDSRYLHSVFDMFIKSILKLF